MLAQLDSPEFVSRNDPKGMMELALGFPDQCRKALAIAEKLSFPDDLRNKNNVLVAGMGGSAAGGDFLRALFDAEGSVPCAVCRDYDLPGFAGKDTLVFACSYSGDTEETLAATSQALRKGCSLLAVTTGGKLREMASEAGSSVIAIPSGQPPRTALGYLFMPALHAAVSCGYLPAQDTESVFALLDQCAKDWGPSAPLDTNSAKGLAAYLFGRVPVIYGLGSWQGAVAGRWRSQLNENAKVMAFDSAFPELNHNAIMGWTLSDKQNVKHWAVVILENGHESPRMQARARVTRELIRDKSEAFTVTAKGDTLLENMLSLAYFSDFLSLYLAALYGVDPERIDAISALKKALSELD